MKAKKDERVSLMWFDDDPKRCVTDKIIHAIARFEAKYGKSARICFVHPGQGAAISKVGNVDVRESAYCIIHHFIVCE